MRRPAPPPAVATRVLPPSSAAAAAAASATATSSAAAAAPAAASASSSLVASLPGQSSFYSSFFLPMTFYKQLEYRQELHRTFLRRSLHYGLPEATAERRRAQRKTAQQTRRRGGSTHGPTTAGATTTASFTPPSAGSRVRIHVDDLLGLKLAAESAAATHANVDAIPPHASLVFSRQHASKQLHVTLENIVFQRTRGEPAAPIASSLHVTAQIAQNTQPAIAMLSDRIVRMDGTQSSHSASTYSDVAFTFASVNFLTHTPPRVFRNRETGRNNAPAAPAAAASSSSASPSSSSSAANWSLCIGLTVHAPKLGDTRVEDSLQETIAHLHHSAPSASSAANDITYVIQHPLCAHGGNFGSGIEEEATRVHIVAQSGAATSPHVVGSCVLKVRWRYRLHPPSATGPRAMLRESSTRPTPSILTWRFISAHADPAGTEQIEQRVGFACAICSMPSASASVSSIHASAGCLASFDQLRRHVEASHSGFLAFHFDATTRAAAAAERPTAAAANSGAQSTTYEISVMPHPRTAYTLRRLLPIILLHSRATPAVGDMVPPAFAKQLAKMQASVARESTQPPPQQMPPEPDMPLGFYAHFGGRYAKLVRKRPPPQQQAPSASSTPATRPPTTIQTAAPVLHQASLSAEALLVRARSGSPTPTASGATPTPSESPPLPSYPSGGLPSRIGQSSACGVGRRPGARLFPSYGALYSRQWYHSSSGTPLTVGELGYDSDAAVDEEWYLEQNARQVEELEDVSLAEKALMKVWNEFLLRKQSGNSGGGSGSVEQVYPDYQYPNLCLTFARTCASLVRPHLRSAFLCHLMTSWQFGLLDHQHIEATMRALDESAEIYPVKAAVDYISANAPAATPHVQVHLMSAPPLTSIAAPAAAFKQERKSHGSDAASSADGPVGREEEEASQQHTEQKKRSHEKSSKKGKRKASSLSAAASADSLGPESASSSPVKLRSTRATPATSSLVKKSPPAKKKPAGSPATTPSTSPASKLGHPPTPGGSAMDTATTTATSSSISESAAEMLNPVRASHSARKSASFSMDLLNEAPSEGEEEEEADDEDDSGPEEEQEVAAVADGHLNNRSPKRQRQSPPPSESRRRKVRPADAMDTSDSEADAEAAAPPEDTTPGRPGSERVEPEAPASKMEQTDSNDKPPPVTSAEVNESDCEDPRPEKPSEGSASLTATMLYRPAGSASVGPTPLLEPAPTASSSVLPVVGSSDFGCQGCGDEFPDGAALALHLMTHSKGRPHVCAFCGEGFTQAGHCREHQVIHTGERNFKCPVDGCKAAFTRAIFLAHHQRIHANAPANKPPVDNETMKEEAHPSSKMVAGSGSATTPCAAAGSSSSDSIASRKRARRTTVAGQEVAEEHEHGAAAVAPDAKSISPPPPGEETDDAPSTRKKLRTARGMSARPAADSTSAVASFEGAHGQVDVTDHLASSAFDLHLSAPLSPEMKAFDYGHGDFLSMCHGGDGASDSHAMDLYLSHDMFGSDEPPADDATPATPAAAAAAIAADEHKESSPPRVSRPSRPKYPCPHCGEVFTRARQMFRHEKCHANQRPWVCLVTGCAMSFGRKSNMLQHVKFTHKRPGTNEGETDDIHGTPEDASAEGASSNCKQEPAAAAAGSPSAVLLALATANSQPAK